MYNITCIYIYLLLAYNLKSALLCNIKMYILLYTLAQVCKKNLKMFIF